MGLGDKRFRLLICGGLCWHPKRKLGFSSVILLVVLCDVKDVKYQGCIKFNMPKSDCSCCTSE